MILRLCGPSGLLQVVSSLVDQLVLYPFLQGPICLSTPDVVFRLIVSPGEDELLPGLPRGMVRLLVSALSVYAIATLRAMRALSLTLRMVPCLYGAFA